jgi:uncharacterized protein (DUF2384 family)
MATLHEMPAGKKMSLAHPIGSKASRKQAKKKPSRASHTAQYLIAAPTRGISQKKLLAAIANWKRRPLDPDPRKSSIFSEVVAFFKGVEREAVAWMMQPRSSLGGAKPVELAKTPEGSQRVLNLLFKLENGVIV